MLSILLKTERVVVMLDEIRSAGTELVKASYFDADGACLSARESETMYFSGRTANPDCLDETSIKKLPAQVKIPEFTNCEELALHRFVYTYADCGAIIQCNRSRAVAVSLNPDINRLEIHQDDCRGRLLPVAIFDDACSFINSVQNLDSFGAVIFRGDKVLIWGRDFAQCLAILKSLEDASFHTYNAA